MSGKMLFAVSILGTSLIAGGAAAQNFTPAELPPASFTASQYVDSEGCVFVRAGASGNVSWIPRMDRQRNHICNARPTSVARAEPPVVQGAATQTASVVRGQAAVSPTIAVTTPRTTNLLIGGSRIARTTTVPAATSRVPLNTGTAIPATTQTASSCPNASALSRQYINHGQHGPVRCGPQPVHPMDVHRPNGAVPTPAGSNRSGGPLTYAFGARPPFEPVNASPQTPAGYRVAWDDGRLNPNRGPQGGTQYAATSAATSQLSATVSTRNAPATTRRAPARAQQAAPDGRVAVSVGVGHRFVQVGTYRQEDSVQRAIRSLRRLGLPAARSSMTSGGQTYHVVLAGPYADATALGTALYRARQAGFTDAITRR